jgi:DeoR family glycerol-3-phosphate regulon repressor
MSGADPQIQRVTARRQAAIMALVRETGRVSVDEMAARFAVTPQTIRRDLNELSDAGVLTRVHGGAVIASTIENLAYEARKLVAQQEKRLIGQAAAAFVPDHSSLFINLGTTTEEVARAIAGRTGLLVVTNNINVATELYRNPAIDVVIAGGSIRPSDGGIIGHMAVEMIRNYSVDLAVIGTSAIDPDGTLLDYDVREVQVSRAIMENARQVILVADSSKFSRHAPVRIARLSEIDILVTDRLPSPEIAELCRRHEVRVVETGGLPEEP